MKRTSLILAALAVLGGMGQAKAGLVTSSAGFTTTAVVDFSQFNGSFQSTLGPVQVGALVGLDITWESTNSNALIGNNSYGLSVNGRWDSGRNGYVGLNTPQSNQSMTFRFNTGPVSEVGGFVNYTPDFGAFSIEALAGDGTVLESYNISALAPIFTPTGQNAGAFRGISRSTTDIAAFRLTGAYAVLDDLTFGTPSMAAVPEPSSLALLGMAGISFAGYFGWRRRKQPQPA